MLLKLIIFFLLFPSILMAQNTKPLITTDNGSNTCNTTRMVFSAGALSCSGSTATITTGSGSGWTLTDGSHTVTGATQVTVTGGTVGGSTPNATLTISGSGSPGGSTTQVQYNSSGSFAGNSGFIYTGTNVGIGSATPGQILDVQGTARVSSGIFSPNVNTLSGQLAFGSSGTANINSINDDFSTFSGFVLESSPTASTMLWQDFPHKINITSAFPNTGGGVGLLGIVAKSNTDFIENAPSNFVDGMQFNTDDSVATNYIEELHLNVGTNANLGTGLAIGIHGTGQRGLIMDVSSSAVGVGTALPSYGILVEDKNGTGAADLITAQNNGAVSFVVQHGGNVGIGTDLPQASGGLEIGNVGANLQMGTSSGTPTISSSGNLVDNVGASSFIFLNQGLGMVPFTNNTWALGASSFQFSTANINTFQNDNNINLAPTNNVGVGSANPGQKLDVKGTIRSTGFTLSGNGAASGFILQSSGSLGIGTWVPAPTGGGGSGTVTSVATDSTLTGGTITTTGTLGINLTNANTWTGQQIFNTANVGINTATPGQRLDVQGTIRASSLIGAGVGNVGIGTSSVIGSGPDGKIMSLVTGTSAPEQSLNYYGRWEISDGTAASPAVNTWQGHAGNTLKISRYDNTLLGACDGTGTDSECDAALSADVSQASTATNNSAAGYFFLNSAATASIDATAIYGIGNSTANARGTGGYLEGDRNSSSGSSNGLEARADNLTSSNCSYSNLTSNAGGCDAIIADGQGNLANTTSLSSAFHVVQADVSGTPSKFHAGLTINSGTLENTGIGIDDNSGGAIGILEGGSHTYALLTTSGNVGINTTTPFQNFMVVGNVGIGTTVANGLMKNFAPAAPGGSMYIQGNIGIGTWDTTTTTGQVQIYSPTTSAVSAVVSNSASAYGQFAAVNNLGSTFIAGMGGSTAALVPNTGFNGTSGTQDLDFYTNNTVAVTIKGSSQNVGIGTVNPQGLLNLGGNCKTSTGDVCMSNGRIGICTAGTFPACSSCTVC